MGHVNPTAGRDAGFTLMRHRTTLTLFILLGLLVFAVTTYSYRSETLLYRLDHPVLDTVHGWYKDAPGWFRVVGDVTTKATNVGLGIAATLLAIYWAFKRCWCRVGLLLVVDGGAGLLFLGLAYLFDRTRPGMVGLLSAVPLPSYPSGHVLTVMGFLAVLLYVYLPRLRTARSQWLAVALAVLFLAWVGLVRLLEGVHYFTDVIAAAGVGLAWVLLTLAAVERWCHAHGRDDLQATGP